MPPPSARTLGRYNTQRPHQALQYQTHAMPSPNTCRKSPELGGSIQNLGKLGNNMLKSSSEDVLRAQNDADLWWRMRQKPIVQ